MEVERGGVTEFGAVVANVISKELQARDVSIGFEIVQIGDAEVDSEETKHHEILGMLHSYPEDDVPVVLQFVNFASLFSF